MRRWIAAASCLAVCLGPSITGGVAAASAGVRRAAPAHHARQHHPSRHRRWVHHANLDDDGHPDRIVITAGRRLHLNDHLGTGPYTLHVRLTSTGAQLRLRLTATSYGSYSPTHRHWSPWLGATDLDHVGGDELLLGQQSGASSSTFYAIAYTEGRLVELPAPDPFGWNANSDTEVGNGVKCAASGVVLRSYSTPSRGQAPSPKVRIERQHYRWVDDSWHLLTGVDRVVPRKGNESVTRYGSIDCPGLPRTF